MAALRSAVELRERFGFDQIRFVPCHLPPHRAQPGADSAQRLRMVELALADEPGLIADARELRRAGPSYTFDTLTELRAELGAQCALLTDGRPDYLSTKIPAGQTDILVSYTYRIAFRDSGTDFGLAAAISTLIFILVAGMSLLNLRLMRKANS